MVAPTLHRTPANEDSVDRLIAGFERLINTRIGTREVGYRHDVAGSPTTTGYIHGPGGHLSYPGVDQDVFHNIVGARGLVGQLPARASVDTNPLFTVLTGISEDTGDEKTEVCDDAKVAGILSSCSLTSPFGRYERATPQIEINRLGQRRDRADPMDLRLVGTPVQDAGIFEMGPNAAGVPGGVLQNEIATRMWALSVSLHRTLALQSYVGNPANNSAGGGYKEWVGLNLLINSGHRDAITGTTCPSVDSDIKDFNYQSVDDAGTELVEALTYMFRYVSDLADRTGLAPVRWVFAMRPHLWYEVSAIWPCAYLTYRCGFDSDAARILVDGAEQVRMRDAMRAGRYLLIDGIQVEVVLDDGIPIETPAEGNVPEGNVASDIYLIPMSVLGGRAVTYIEYFDYDNPSITSALGMIPAGMYTVQGPWITTHRMRNWCLEFQTKIEPRMVLRTPWLAGRLQNVVSTSFQMTRSPFPSDPYYVGGDGVTSRPGPSYYALWQE